MSKSKVTIAVLAIVVMATFAFAQTKSTVIGTVHDINSGGCKSCHAPHNGSVATGGTDQNTGKILLWDRGFTNVTFGTYSSPTMNSVAAEVGTTTPAATDPRLYSFLCLSCHDGVTSPTLIGPTNTKAIGNVTKSAGLTNDHPINMAHDPTLDTGLKTVAQVTGAGLFLYGTSNTVQCASCHNVHNNTNSPFLRKANTNSALCTSCHL